MKFFNTATFRAAQTAAKKAKEALTPQDMQGAFGATAFFGGWSLLGYSMYSDYKKDPTKFRENLRKHWPMGSSRPSL